MPNRVHVVVVLGCGLACAVAASGQTGDFNGDGLWDCHDMDLLEADIRKSPGDRQFDLDDNGTVDFDDRDRWLSAASEARGYRAPFEPGDANLDGIIDHLDLNIFALHSTTWHIAGK